MMMMKLLLLIFCHFVPGDLIAQNFSEGLAPGKSAIVKGMCQPVGLRWKKDKCTTCYCNEYGLSMCKDVYGKCPSLPCSDPFHSEDSCCPKCPQSPSCITEEGYRYNDSQTWKEDDCKTCECRNGKINCVSTLCQVTSCANPFRVPGVCCPQCEEGMSPICNIVCPEGYKTDTNGQNICECREQIILENVQKEDSANPSSSPSSPSSSSSLSTSSSSQEVKCCPYCTNGNHHGHLSNHILAIIIVLCSLASIVLVSVVGLLILMMVKHKNGGVGVGVGVTPLWRSTTSTNTTLDHNEDQHRHQSISYSKIPNCDKNIVDI